MKYLLLGGIIGDICGSVYEFSRWRTKDISKVNLYSPHATFTDDTICTIAVADHLMTGEPIMDFDLEEMLNIMKTCNPKQINIGVNSSPKRFPIPEPNSNKAKELIIKLKDFFKVSVHNPKQKL